MSAQASFALRGRNPDVLTCIANLSNDEVFTPPELANRMLDTLAEAWSAAHGGANIWGDKTGGFSIHAQSPASFCVKSQVASPRAWPARCLTLSNGSITS